MGDSIKVDARGLSCPEPVILAKQAMRQKAATNIEVLVDSGAARDNVRRAAEKANCAVEITELSDGEFRLDLTRDLPVN